MSCEYCIIPKSNMWSILCECDPRDIDLLNETYPDAANKNDSEE